MAKNIVLVMLYLLSVSLMAQTGFMKSYDIEGTDSNNGTDLLSINNAYIILTGPNCSNTGLGCTGMIKTDTTGIKQWDNLFENEEGNLLPLRGFQNLGDAGFIVTGEMGHLEGYGTLFFLRISTQGDSLQLREYGNEELREIGIPTTMLNDTLLGLVSWSNIAATYANDIRLIKMDTCLSNLTEIALLGVNGYLVNFGWGINPAPDGVSLYINIVHRNNTPPNYYATVRKINLMGDTLWTYPLSGYTTSTNITEQVVVLDNGNIVTRWFNEEFGSANEQNPYLICLNDQGEFVWRYNFNDNAYKKFPVAITKAANGDIIGCGFVNNPNYNYSSGWLFRLSPNGELLWEREYVSYTPTVNFLVPQGIDEDDNGNIIATGAIIDALPTGGYEGNALLLKVLPNGCFTPNCNGGAEDTLIVASTVVGIKEASPLPPPKEGGLVISPNPTNDVLQILLPNQRVNAQIHITNLLGSTLKIVPLPPHYKQPYFSIATHDLPNGMYLVSYTVAGKQAITAKLIIVH